MPTTYTGINYVLKQCVHDVPANEMSSSSSSSVNSCAVIYNADDDFGDVHTIPMRQSNYREANEADETVLQCFCQATAL